MACYGNSSKQDRDQNLGVKPLKGAMLSMWIRRLKWNKFEVWRHCCSIFSFWQKSNWAILRIMISQWLDLFTLNSWSYKRHSILHLLVHVWSELNTGKLCFCAVLLMSRNFVVYSQPKRWWWLLMKESESPILSTPIGHLFFKPFYLYTCSIIGEYFQLTRCWCATIEAYDWIHNSALGFIWNVPMSLTLKSHPSVPKILCLKRKQRRQLFL